MIRLLKKLLNDIEPELEKMARLSESELHKCLSDILEEMPLPEFAVKMQEKNNKLRELLKGRKHIIRTGKEDTDTKVAEIRSLRAELVELRSALGKDESLRLYKKIAGFLCERLLDILRRDFKSTKERARKLRLIDKALETMELTSKVIPKFENGIVHADVEDTDMGMTSADKAASSPQKDLLKRLSSPIDNWDGKKPGIYLPAEDNSRRG